MTLTGATAPSAVRHRSANSTYLMKRHTTEPSLKPVVSSVRLSAEKDTVFTPPLRYEWHCSSMVCSWRGKGARHENLAAEVVKRERLKDTASPTIAEVSRRRTKPSRPTDDSHMLWGDKTSEAGPSGWPLASWSGVSRTTCLLDTPSMFWGNGARKRYVWRRKTWTLFNFGE